MGQAYSPATLKDHSNNATTIKYSLVLWEWKQKDRNAHCLITTIAHLAFADKNQTVHLNESSQAERKFCLPRKLIIFKKVSITMPYLSIKAHQIFEKKENNKILKQHFLAVKRINAMQKVKKKIVRNSGYRKKVETNFSAF